MAKRPFWTVPRIWQGKTVAVLASGESMNQALAQRVGAAGIPTIVVNNTYKLLPSADMLVANDKRWWEYWHEAQQFAGIKVCAAPLLNEATKAYSRDHPGAEVCILRVSGREGFDPDPNFTRSNANSGATAVHIAAHAGAKRILLFGFDMRGGHWHGSHATPLRDHGEGIYEDWIRLFGVLGEALRERGIEIVNCTHGSALSFFRFSTLEAELATCTLTAA